MVVDDLRIVELRCVLDGVGREGEAGQRGGTAQTIGDVVALELVAQGEGVLLPELKIDARRNLEMIGGAEEAACNRFRADRPGVGGGCRAVDRSARDRVDVVILRLAVFDAEEVRGFL